MNNTMSSDRLLRIAPLVLRWGVAAILIYNGLQQVTGMFGAERGESFLADIRGVELTANWESIVGAGQLAVGGLLAIGLLTRLTSLAVLGLAGYCVFAATGSAEVETTTAAAQETVGFAAQLFQTNGASLMMLAAVCGSLLVSGAGCLALDTRRGRRFNNAESAAV